MLEHLLGETKAPKRVVVIGSRGFVGRNVCAQLKESGIPTVECSSSDIDLVEASSVSKLKDLIRPGDSVVLISALTPDKGRDVHTMMKNLRMMENVHSALMETPCEHLIYISSDAVYSTCENPISEKTPCDPDSYHGIMHITREKMLADAVKAQGIPLLILRPVALYGKEDTHNGYGPNRFFKTASENNKITLFGNGEEQRDHVFIKDVALLVQRALERKTVGLVTLATGKSISFFDVAQEVMKNVDGECELECLERNNPITHVHFDTTELIKAFPDFSFTALEQGVKELCA